MTVWSLSPHAEERMEEMGIECAEVREVLNDYDSDYPGAKQYPPGRRVRVGGRLAIVYEEESREVITVLWNRQSSRKAGPAC